MVSFMVWCFMVFLLWFGVLWYFFYGLAFYGISFMHPYICGCMKEKQKNCMSSLPVDEHLDFRSMSETLQIN